MRPFADLNGRVVADQRFPPNRIGALWKKPWNIVVPISVSGLMLSLFIALVIGCYMLVGPAAAYGAAALCALAYAPRYIHAREFQRDRQKMLRLWKSVSFLYIEVQTGNYDADEIISRFSGIVRDGLFLPSIFVSVMKVREARPTT